MTRPRVHWWTLSSRTVRRKQRLWDARQRAAKAQQTLDALRRPARVKHGPACKCPPCYAAFVETVRLGMVTLGRALEES